MKPVDFFLDKAKQYVSELDSIISNYVQFDDITFSETDPYNVQKKKIAELKLKIKLLFSEFDKGEFFIDEIKKTENSVMHSFDREDNLRSYKSSLELFIDHINQFRN